MKQLWRKVKRSSFLTLQKDLKKHPTSKFRLRTVTVLGSKYFSL
jgi:hypothetical protein